MAEETAPPGATGTGTAPLIDSAADRFTDKAAGAYRLTWDTKILYGLGSIATGIKTQGLSAFVLLFFNQVLGMPADWVGLAIMLALIADAIQDPIVGQMSDRTRSQWGRRHPWMYFAALPGAVLFYLLWNPPMDLSNEWLFAYLLTILILLRFVMSCYDIPSAALGPELAPNYDDRAGLFAWRFFFAIAGGLVMVTFTYQYLLPVDPNADIPEGSTYLGARGFNLYGLIGAIAIFASIMVATLGTHRHISHLHKPDARAVGLREIMRQVIETLWSKSVIVITVSGLISAVAGGLSSGLSAYFGLYYWAMPPEHVAYLVLAGAFSSIVATVLAPRLARRFDKKPAVMILMWGSLILGTAPMVGRMLHLMPANGTNELLWILIFVTLLAGAAATMAAIIISSMIADIVEERQADTGRRSEGLLFSADNILQKSITGAGVFLSGLLLTAVDFPANASPKTIDPEVLENLALVYVPVTTALYAAAVACIHFFPITRARHAENLARIRARADS